MMHHLASSFAGVGCIIFMLGSDQLPHFALKKHGTNAQTPRAHLLVGAMKLVFAR
jgi:hypothetical protein